MQLLHGSCDRDAVLLDAGLGSSKTVTARAAAALHNIVHCHPDDKQGRREARALRLLEQIRAHCEMLDHLLLLRREEAGAASSKDPNDQQMLSGEILTFIVLKTNFFFTFTIVVTSFLHGNL